MFHLKKWATFGLLLIFTEIGWSQETLRAAVYNNSGQTASTTSPDLYSAIYMMDVAGLPFDVINSTENLHEYRLILMAHPCSSENLQDEEVSDFVEYVSNGGTLIIPGNKDSRMFFMSGISSAFDVKSPRMRWAISSRKPELKYFNDTLEQVISLGKSEVAAITSKYFTTTTALVLARYENDKPAVVYNELRNGKVYTFGVQWKDVVLRPQVNNDYEAQRVYSNGFEPSADVFPLFIRAVWENICPIAMWKHTLPESYQGLLLITHDVDSRTGYDTMGYFSAYEKSIGISTHYFATTHYLKDDLLSAFYDEKSITALKQVAANGHTIGSHSVSHLPDFDKETIVLRGKPGNSPSNYFPMYLNSLGHSVNGTVWGEAEVSKYLLERDLGKEIISWRSGHLCYPKALIQVLDSNNYTLNSTQSANDILSNFPYIAQNRPAVEYNPSNVLEIPMTISDVNYVTPISSTNYLEFVNRWYNITMRNARNYAPTVLLIHPNRRFKVAAQKALIEILPDQVGIYNFGRFGKFWRNRMNTSFSVNIVSENNLVIKVNSDDFFEMEPPVSFIIKDVESKKGFDKLEIMIETPSGQSRKAYLNRVDDSLVMVHPRSPMSVGENDEQRFQLIPNPAKDHFVVVTSFNEKVECLEIIDLTGKIVLQKLFYDNSPTYGPVSVTGLQAGLYVCRIRTTTRVKAEKLLITR